MRTFKLIEYSFCENSINCKQNFFFYFFFLECLQAIHNWRTNVHKKHNNTHNVEGSYHCSTCFLIWKFIFSAWSSGFFIHNGQWPPTSIDFRISLLMFSAKQWNYWYHFYNLFGMTRSLTGDWTRDMSHSKLALYH